MASFTGVGDNTELQMAHVGDTVDIAISGTYDMTILFQREVGSPGSGAWETLKTYTTANATVAEKHTTEAANEKLRLIVTVDNSGTATATLTDGAEVEFPELDIKTPNGEKIMTFGEETIQMHKALRGAEPIVLTGDITLDVDVHGERCIIFNTAAGDTVTLPEATGSGIKFRFFVNTTVTSNADIIQVTTTDIIQGAITVVTDTGGITVPTASTSDTITMNGTTTGGVKGSYLELEDVADGVWRVEGALVSTGAEATPFSAAVS